MFAIGAACALTRSDTMKRLVTFALLLALAPAAYAGESQERMKSCNAEAKTLPR